MILAAGVGSRLEPLTCNTPKPMVPIANRPAMEHILALLARHGFSQVTANLWYLPERITNYFGDGQGFGVQLSYSREKELLGTAGGVKAVQAFFDDTFLVIAGDALTDIDLTEMLAFHRERKALATIALRPVDDPTHFGVVVTDAEGRITGFQEKPSRESALSLLANTGIYLFEREVLDLIPAGAFYDFGKNLFPELVARNAAFYGYKMSGYWCDVGTLGQYRLAHQDVLRGECAVFTPGVVVPTAEEPLAIGPDVEIDPTAVVQGRVLIGSGSKIGPGAHIVGDVVIGERCRIDAGAQLDTCVVWSGAAIGEEARVANCVVGQDVVINPHAVVGQGSTLSDACVVEAYTEVAAGAAVWPGQVVGPDSEGDDR